jgi:DNA-binding SARP family transcriptional activator
MGSGPGDASSLDTGGPTLCVRLLGGFDMRLGEVPVPPLDSARAESLLAFLLLHRDAPRARERIAFLLWPDSTESQAQTNLRHLLHTLRRSLPDAGRFIEVRPRVLRWRAQAPLWLDVTVFERAVAEGRLQEAVEMYRGDLLEGSCDDWLLEERERLAQLHIHALERLAYELQEEGRWSEAIGYAERLVRRDPLREETYRLLMRLWDGSGDRARALRAYHACVAMLQRELGVGPSAATHAAYDSLLAVAPERGAQDQDGPATQPRAPRGEPAASAWPLVGRMAEWARLAALWHEVERGTARLVLVTGEPGVGKSRLVEELRSWCAHGGAVTAEGRAYRAEGEMAYGFLAALLRSEAIAPRLRRLDRVQLTELARLLPELLSKVPDLAVPEPLPEGEQRQRLFRAAARAILATGTPVLLVADDLQWCDVQTLQFVHYLVRAEPGGRLLVAATARREEMGARHPVSELVTGLQALGGVCEIGLERLSREETGVLAERVAGRPLADAEVERLYAHSEGNPLFVVEALRADPGTAFAHGARGGPQGRAVLAARLAQLSEPAADLVGVAATIGREFTTEVLADASGMDEPGFVRGLDELWRRGLVRAHGPNAYDFSHGKIREAAYRALSPAQARHHHLRAARALERHRAADRDAISGRVAAHYDAAGAGGEAIAWYQRAAEAAQRLHASADAVKSLERALELTRSLPDGAERAALELRLLTALPAPLVAVEGYLSERVAQVHGRALDLAAALNAEPDATLVRSLALAALTRSDFQAASLLGEQLVALAEREGDDALRAESAYVLGLAAFWQGRLEAARANFEAAVERYRAGQQATRVLRYGQDSQVFCLMRLAYTLWLLGCGDEAGRVRDAALALSERSGQPYTRATAHVWAGLLALDQHDIEGLRQHVQAFHDSDLAEGPRQRQPAAEAFTGLLETLGGHPRAGVERARRAFDAVRAGPPAAPGVTAGLMRILLEAHAIAGDAQAGLATADEALEMGEGAQLWEAEIRRLRAEFMAAAGAASEVVDAELMRAIEVAERQGARSFGLRARESLARLHAGRR